MAVDDELVDMHHWRRLLEYGGTYFAIGDGVIVELDIHSREELARLDILLQTAPDQAAKKSLVRSIMRAVHTN